MKNRDRVPGLRVSLVRDAGVSLPAPHGQIVDTPAKLAAIAAQFVPPGDEREHFLAIYVNPRNELKGVAVISIGTLSASLVHPREVFRPAIVAGAAAVVVAHNHPSGDPTPSSEDKEATRRLQKAGELLGVPLLDHVIITEGAAYFSFRERGIF